MFNDGHKSYKSTIIFAVVVTIVVLMGIILVALTIPHEDDKALLDILVSPVDAKIVVGDSEYRNAIYEMTPGHYEVVVSRDGFKTVETELDIIKGGTVGLYLYLEPTNNSWGFYSKRENLASLDTLLRLKGFDNSGEVWTPALPLNQESEGAREETDRFTIRSIMPMRFSQCGEPASRMTCNAIEVEYDYSEKCDDELCLIITGRYDVLQSDIVDMIKNELNEKGYDFNDYKYVYIQNTEL